MLFLFAGLTLDLERRELRRGPDLISVEPQVFDLLTHLIQNRHRVVSKDDLIATIWEHRVVSESTMNSRINAARRAIGDSGVDQRLIRTIPRKGIRFVGEVSEEQDSTGQPGPNQPLAPPAMPDRPSIAVLPLVNLSGDPEQEYFVDGMTEEIIIALSRVRWFFVIARHSTFAYKNKDVDYKEIARDLGVRYLLTGSVRCTSERIRIGVQLIDCVGGSNIWARSYDRALADIFAVQDEITQTIVGAIEPELSRAERERARAGQATRQSGCMEHLSAWDVSSLQLQPGRFHRSATAFQSGDRVRPQSWACLFRTCRGLSL